MDGAQGGVGLFAAMTGQSGNTITWSGATELAEIEVETISGAASVEFGGPVADHVATATFALNSQCCAVGVSFR